MPCRAVVDAALDYREHTGRGMLRHSYSGDVLAISQTLPGPSQVGDEGPIRPKQQISPQIPRSQFARIRAWRRYGLTAQQVAEMYGVAADEIERILR
jgi:hypothetical protein